MKSASTTSTIPKIGCETFAALQAVTLIASDATAFGRLGDETLPVSQALQGIDALHLQLNASLRFAAGPMGDHLRGADRVLRQVKARVQALPTVGGFVGAPDKQLDHLRTKVYEELLTAGELLGTTCGGHLVPEGTDLLFPKKLRDAISTTTKPR